MKISYNSLNEFFNGTLPSPAKVEEAFTFHAWEVEEVVEKDNDTVFDIKVLPDKSAWALSHRGIAKDLSVILNVPLERDPLRHLPILEPLSKNLSIEIATPVCTRYIAAHLTGIKIAPSPEWLQKRLVALGQRSINNIVDITNYVMLGIGQPLHAFDARKLSTLKIGVRQAVEGEKITSLTGETYTLTATDTVIVDGGNNVAIGIAGVKGGKVAEVDQSTTEIIIESAHFDPIAIRKTSQRLKLRTDASQRFENCIVSDMTAYAIRDAVKFITEGVESPIRQLADGGGTLVGFVDTGENLPTQNPVSVSLSKINSVLGLSLSVAMVSDIFTRFGYVHSWEGDTVLVAPPFERPDLVIAEDLIEEVGRMHGYDHVVSVVPSAIPVSEMNTTFFYSDAVRTSLTEIGFSEVFTSSFREKDSVKIKNALASDKGYLRSSLTPNIGEALAKNVPLADLVGVRAIQIFEIGTVFTKDGEHLSLALGAQSGSEYRPKTDDPLLSAGKAAVEKIFGTSLSWNQEKGVTEAALTSVIATLPKPTAYAPFEKKADVAYVPFSPYPHMSRDIAFWAPEGMTVEAAASILTTNAGPLLTRLSLFDTFSKDGKTSYAFRLVFISYERTLTDTEINGVMSTIAEALVAKGGTVR